MSCLDENTITDFVEQRLAPEEVGAIEAHLDECAACREFAAGFARALVTEANTPESRTSRTKETHSWSAPEIAIEPGRALGRYIVLSRLGAGGMGVVFLAYDPTLDRKVALKLLRTSDSDARARERLLREAKAMARLAHPNVATVHDVGTIDGSPFVAMELFEGGTLADWLRTPRPIRSILAVFAAAGRGLEAAHRAGLVHRDFKPENVLLATRDDATGRICVTDFGLAQEVLVESSDGVESPAPNPDRATRGGTPGYMSPEQVAGRPTSAASDQYSFCVALYQALYGESPFEKNAPKSSRVPAYLRDVLLRGLAEEPAARFPSMGALLEALDNDPSQRTKRRLYGALAVMSLGLVAFGGARLWPSKPLLCEDAGSEIASSWNAEKRAALTLAFQNTKAPFASAALERVQSTLDTYTKDYRAMSGESCAATRLRGTQSDDMQSLRAACLDERRREVSALIDVLSQADAKVVERATTAVAGLTPIEVCGNLPLLSARVRPPTDAHVRTEVTAIQDALARAKALSLAGKYKDAMAAIKAVVTRARATNYRPLIAEALLTQGRTEERLSAFNDAEKTLLESTFNAEASKEDEVAAAAWTTLIKVTTMQPSLERADQYVPRAEAALLRLGGGPDLEDDLTDHRAFLALAHGHTAESEQMLRAHLESREKRIGKDNPALISTLSELARVEGYLGRFDDVLKHRQRSLLLATMELGPDHPRTASAQQAVATALADAGQLEEAERIARKAVATFESTYGQEHTVIVASLLALGSILVRRGAVEEGLATLHHGLAIESKTYPDTHPAIALARQSLSEALLRLNRPKEALPLSLSALTAWQALGKDHFVAVSAEVLVARCHLALKDYESALPLLEHALANRSTHPGSPVELAAIELGLAQSLKGPPARARDLAERALKEPTGDSEDAKQEREKARAWLESATPPRDNAPR
jgi:serine/threonine protein kinase